MCMDNFFRWDFADNLIPFHDRPCPARQVHPLKLWDLISCPFEDKKQDHGSELKIIRFFIDVNHRSITLSPSSISDIVDKLDSFLSSPNQKAHLQKWQRLGGHLNW